MLYRIPQLIEHVSGIMTLEEGDVILTGSSSLSVRPNETSLCLTLGFLDRYAARSGTNQG